MEASSHGLDQCRLDGVRLAAAGFTNLTQDHLDYHGTMGAYRAAKLRLFDALLPPGATAVVNADMDAATLAALRAIAARRGLRSAHGRRGRARDLRLLARRRVPDGQALTLEVGGAPRERRAAPARPLPGRQRPGGRGPGDRRWAPSGACWTASRRCAACAAGWSWRRGCRTAPRSMSTTPTRRTRWSGC